jgi:hypothetical protein
VLNKNTKNNNLSSMDMNVYGSDLQLVHLAFNWVKELSLKFGDSLPHLISIFQRIAAPRLFQRI